MKCHRCGSTILHRIDSGWKGETDRPYGIYMCIGCRWVSIKYDDEL